MRKGLLGLWILSLCLLLGCAAQEAAAEEKTLWVVTEQSMSDGMRYQANEIAKAFMDAHPDMTVQLDILPVDADQRELYLYQLRTEILSGGGPDVYLLPTGSTLYRDVNYGRVMEYEIEPLFPDVQLAMVNGLFTDVSAYYDQDSALHTEALNAAVMDAGVLDGRRYVLPIRYNLPVLLANPEAIEVREDLCLEDLAELAVETQDTMLAVSLQMPDDLSCFAQVFDYEAGEVLLTQEELVRYFTLYQQIHAMTPAAIRAMGEATFETLYQDYPEEFRPALEEWLETYPYQNNYYCEVPYFTSHRTYWRTDGFPVYTGDLIDTLHAVAVDKYLEVQSIYQPLRTARGTVTATVTYFGAVGAGCGDPALAYEFLRAFLDEDAQWEILRPRANYENCRFLWELPPEPQNRGFIENSWPVRTQGSVYYLWDTLEYQMLGAGFLRGGTGTRGPYDIKQTTKQVYAFCNRLPMGEEDMPLLFTDIDEVRFPVHLSQAESMAQALQQLNEEDGTPTDVDIEALAAQLHQNLWWHLAEG